MILTDIKAQIAADNGCTLDELIDMIRTGAKGLVIAKAAAKFQRALREFAPATQNEKFGKVFWLRKFALCDQIVDTDDAEDFGQPLRPGEMSQFLHSQGVEMPYGNPTLDMNLRVAGGHAPYVELDERMQTDRDREPGAECWAESFEAVGLGEILGGNSYQHLLWLTTETIHQMQEGDTMDTVREAVRPAVDQVWNEAVAIYHTGDVNIIALGLLAHRLTSATRYTPDEMLDQAEKVVWRSHTDGEIVYQMGQKHNGKATVADFLREYQDVLDDIVEDGDWEDVGPLFPWQEQLELDILTRTTMQKVVAHWRSQFGQKGSTWAAMWTGEREILYALSYLRAIADGQRPNVAHQTAIAARRGPQFAAKPEAGAAGRQGIAKEAARSQ